MKIQSVDNFLKIAPQIRQQIKDGLYIYKYFGLPVFGFIGADLLKEKYNPQSDFYDKMRLW